MHHFFILFNFQAVGTKRMKQVVSNHIAGERVKLDLLFVSVRSLGGMCFLT